MEEFLQNNITSVAGEVNQQTRIVINNVLTFLTELKEDPHKIHGVNFKKPRDLTALICGVSLRTVTRIKQECKDGGEARIPRQNVKYRRPVTGIDEHHKSIIKEIVTSLCSNGEFPAVEKIVDIAKERIEGLKCSHTSMRRILNGLGYKFKTGPDGKRVWVNDSKSKFKIGKKRRLTDKIKSTEKISGDPNDLLALEWGS